MPKRKLFCEISPLTYKISVLKCRAARRLKDAFSPIKFAKEKSEILLPCVIYQHNSLIRRKLGNVDLVLQENKAANLKIAAPLVNKIIINCGESFSFWHLVGSCTVNKGYKTGLTISKGAVSQDIGGGMCQFTNLIHWLVLHSPLEITEHHHHDTVDLFPDFGRKVPFGTGTSIYYNYVDYRFKNNTNQKYQIIVYTNDEYLCAELRAEHALPVKYHIKAENERFVRQGGDIFRESRIYRECTDKKTGKPVLRELIKTNHARVMYEVDEKLVCEG